MRRVATSNENKLSHGWRDDVRLWLEDGISWKVRS
jgi:hypothetical protein